MGNLFYCQMKIGYPQTTVGRFRTQSHEQSWSHSRRFRTLEHSSDVKHEEKVFFSRQMPWALLLPLRGESELIVSIGHFFRGFRHKPELAEIGKYNCQLLGFLHILSKMNISKKSWTITNPRGPWTFQNLLLLVRLVKRRELRKMMPSRQCRE